MRIWSVHPMYLDTKGLVALWREALLAKQVLEGRTKGYTNHPQLHRFKACSDPVGAINSYLTEVYNEAVQRGFEFDRGKIGISKPNLILPVTNGQIQYEIKHLAAKLMNRDPDRFKEFSKLTKIKPHPIFKKVKGKIEKWEIVKLPDSSKQ